ncbi:MAG: CHAT domain-containing protein [Epsilonproteobacteria bacterium]|nr:CHAT domain-containing protein [Campylobacterota bacterium]
MKALQDSTSDKEVKEKIDEYFQLQRRLGNVYSSLGSAKDEKNRDIINQNIDKIKKELKTIETYLANKLERYKDYQKIKTIDYQQIADILKDDELYIDYAITDVGYFLFTLDHKGKVTFDKLDNAKEIDRLIKKFRRTISKMSRGNFVYPKYNSKEDIKYKKDTKELLNKIYRLVITPIQKEMLSKNRLIISPDGKLNLIPFEILYDNKGRYLVESKNIRYAPSGKSLLQLYLINKNKTNKNQEVELFYNPDFDMKLNKKERSYIATTSKSMLMPKRARGEDGKWSKLLGTKQEGDAISRLYNSQGYKVVPEQEQKATIENLLKVKEPTILHIATHGYFIDDPDIKNPLLKSGIVLSGANTNPAYGQVSALKLSGLNLKGTKLVVLSACETGISTQGLSGLNRVFIQAGAKSVVSSLWKVSDKETKDLMIKMHKNIKKGESPYQSLQEAKKEFIDRDIHPYFWGAFIYSGL